MKRGVTQVAVLSFVVFWACSQNDRGSASPESTRDTVSSESVAESAQDSNSIPESATQTGESVNGAVWSEDFYAALATAKANGRPVLASFSGSDWCIWCKRLKAEVFDQPEFKEWAAKEVVLLELDYPRQSAQKPSLQAQNRKLQQEYDIQSFPSVVFLDTDGTEISRLGYVKGGADAWLQEARTALKR